MLRVTHIGAEEPLKALQPVQHRVAMQAQPPGCPNNVPAAGEIGFERAIEVSAPVWL